MAVQHSGIRIYVVFHTRNIMAYIESHVDTETVDVEATFATCEQGIRDALATVYPDARIVVRRQDPQGINPARSRVEVDDSALDPELIGQEVDDLVAEFDITGCVVYQD
jgi:hypothetical protein